MAHERRATGVEEIVTRSSGTRLESEEGFGTLSICISPLSGSHISPCAQTGQSNAMDHTMSESAVSCL